MKTRNLRLEIFDIDNEEITYQLTYNRKSFLVFVSRNGKFRNKLYECAEEIPEELESFLEKIIRKDLEEIKSDDEFCTVFNDDVSYDD